jgi:hypothetical protein
MRGDRATIRDRSHLGAFLHFRFNETKEMFLIHAARVVDVGIHFSDIIEVTGATC